MKMQGAVAESRLCLEVLVASAPSNYCGCAPTAAASTWNGRMIKRIHLPDQINNKRQLNYPKCRTSSSRGQLLLLKVDRRSFRRRELTLPPTDSSLPISKLTGQCNNNKLKSRKNSVDR